MCTDPPVQKTRINTQLCTARNAREFPSSIGYLGQRRFLHRIFLHSKQSRVFTSYVFPITKPLLTRRNVCFPRSLIHQSNCDAKIIMIPGSFVNGPWCVTLGGTLVWPPSLQLHVLDAPPAGRSHDVGQRRSSFLGRWPTEPITTKPQPYSVAELVRLYGTALIF